MSVKYPLTLAERQNLEPWLKTILKEIPVNWDRVVGAEENLPIMYIYGWIQRKDGKRDFLMLEFDKTNKWINQFLTSSAKYSIQINILLNGKDAPHFPCIPFKDYIKEMSK